MILHTKSVGENYFRLFISMGIFSNIDSRLEQFAIKQNARLTRNRENCDVELGFEERRIDWIKDNIRLAVIIQPNFNNGVDISKWNFKNVAWKYMGAKRFQISKNLIELSNFQEIEDHLDEALTKSDLFLNNIRFEDLELAYFNHSKDVK